MIGPMRDRLLLQSVAETADAGGGFTPAWTINAEIWGNVRPLSGREVLHSQQLAARMTHKITIRYRPNVTVKHRLLIGGTDTSGDPSTGARVFNIRAIVDVDNRHRFLELMCDEGGQGIAT